MVQLRDRSCTARSPPFSIRTWYDQNQRLVDGSDCSARKLTATRTAIPRVTATLGNNMARASMFTGSTLAGALRRTTRQGHPLAEVVPRGASGLQRWAASAR